MSFDVDKVHLHAHEYMRRINAAFPPNGREGKEEWLGFIDALLSVAAMGILAARLGSPSLSALPSSTVRGIVAEMHIKARAEMLDVADRRADSMQEGN